MNRDQRRAMEKALRKKGLSKENAKAYVQIMNNADAIRLGGAGEISPPKHIEEGDKIRLDISRVKARKNYGRMAQGYRDFVESAGDTVFTAHVERENMISLTEDPRWLFWSGDLIINREDDAIDESDA